MKKDDSCDLFLYICRFWDTEKMKTLLDHWFNIDSQDKTGWMTALIIASMNWHKNLVEMLLEHWANTNIQNKDWWTALMMASHEWHKEIVKILLNHKIDVNIQNKDWMTALMRASKEWHKEIVKILLSYWVNIDKRQKNWFTAIMIAGSRHKEIVKMLWEASFLWRPISYNNKKDQKANTLIINDGTSLYRDITLYQNKVYSYSHSPDYYSQYSSIYEYKMDDWFIIYQRLLEDRIKEDWDKEYYDVKDWIVLEKDIIERYNKDKISIGSMLKEPDEEIQRLKNECQWHKIMSYEYKQKYFILSKHPEVISGQELIKYFRKELERIKLWLLKVRELCNKHNFKLEFYSEHSLGLLINHDGSKFYDFLFLNEKDKTTEQKNDFNTEFTSLLQQLNCEKYEMEWSEDIIETLNWYLDDKWKSE